MLTKWVTFSNECGAEVHELDIHESVDDDAALEHAYDMLKHDHVVAVFPYKEAIDMAKYLIAGLR